MATTTFASSGTGYTPVSGPQIGIDRLPLRRLSDEPKEAMNCKSCRKRKIKCNRSRPSCEACRVFNCACIYDAVPKKRGPKTDVVESILHRVIGQEKRLKDEKEEVSSESVVTVQEERTWDDGKLSASFSRTTYLPKFFAEAGRASVVQSSPRPRDPPSPPKRCIDTLVDIYFSRLHGKPYYILDEQATRQRLQAEQLPRYLMNAVYAVSVRYASHLFGGHNAAVRSSQEYALQARTEIDVDEPSIDNLQALLLLSTASFQAGKGKKSYMLLSTAISMALALNLHRELSSQVGIAPTEREGRRRLFWTCYLMDRFTGSGSKRPSLISDESISLRLPAWQAPGSQMMVDGNHFHTGSSLGSASGAYHDGQGSGAMLIDIVRILGVTNRYFAACGVKGDSHFPWHTQSNLSKIRQDLDIWAANTSDAFVSLDILFGQPDSLTLVLSKLIYHLIHCLIYRPFLPVDLTELSGTGQHHSWQIEATNLCFLHANAIAELVEIGKSTSIVDWPPFVGYCICTAGTIHVHGAHYSDREVDVFAGSSDFLSREMAQLSDLRYTWAGVQHQRDTLQTVYACHSQLVKALASNPMRFSPVFQMEDFFDRYPGHFIDGAHVAFSDIIVDAMHESLPAYNGLGNQNDGFVNQIPANFMVGYQPTLPSQHISDDNMKTTSKNKRRRTTNGSTRVLPPTLDSTQSSQNGGHTHTSSSQTCDGRVAPTQQKQEGHSYTNNGRHNYFFPNPASSEKQFSPSFSSGPMPASVSQHPIEAGQQDQRYSVQDFDHRTQSAVSASAKSAQTDLDRDPFLSLLEQLAENDSSATGPSDLDFFLSGQG